MAYRILSLDGGGSWALLEIKGLIAIYGENARGTEVLSRFDMVAANSGGSIVLGLLLEDLTLTEALHFFLSEQRRRTIFSPTKCWFYRLFECTHAFPKYDTNAKLVGLKAGLPKAGGRCFEGITSDVLSVQTGVPVHLLITSFDYDRNRATFFRSSKVADDAWGTGAAAAVTLAEAIHSSSNAPVKYFDKPATFTPNANRYWDGGVSGNNNPVLAAVTEALGLKINPTDIVALSLGTATVARPWARPGEAPSPFDGKRPRADWQNDLGKMASSILDDPPDAATFIAHVMTGAGRGATAADPEQAASRIVRMNPLISPMRRKEDDPWRYPGDWSEERFNDFANLNMDAVEQSQVEEIVRYAELWLADEAMNQPVRMDGGTLKCEIGQAWFSEALRVWLSLSDHSSTTSPRP